LSLVKHNIDLVKEIRALIFDDAVLDKSGKKSEGVSKVHDHVTGRFVFGYKLLVCGYWDGDSFIPVDFSLHRERGSDLDRSRRRRNRARRKVKQAILIYRETRRQYLEQRAKLKLLREESGPVSKKTIQMELEKQQRRVIRSWKKQTKSREKMKQAQAVLKQ